MRWPQFLLTAINLGFACYLLIKYVFISTDIDPVAFLYTLIYLTLALALTHLYMLYMSNKIDDWYDTESMKSIANLSLFSIVTCGIALAVHIVLWYHANRANLTLDSTTTRRIVPLTAALLSSFVLFSSSIKFKKYVLLCKSSDLQPTQNQVRNYRTTDWNSHLLSTWFVIIYTRFAFEKTPQFGIPPIPSGYNN